MKDRLKELLEKGYLLSLGIQDEKGPWVADVIYIYDEHFNIYWISDIGTRHSKAIENNQKGSGAITVSKLGEHNFGIQLEGIARRLEGDHSELAKLYTQRRKKVLGEESVFDSVGKIKDKDESWYLIEPTMIGLIDEENFGFNRQEISL
ncbi:MAG: hypothetical protein Q8P45_00420 [Candidatus Harrisonbacteria bacterium]|nr:hypothetical protein [Candidatus Harrisonbacteria bacterium]